MAKGEHLDFRQLRYFVRMVEAGSISSASHSLHISQPALSKQLGLLEQELGVKLLTRSVRGVTATQAGQAVFRHAQALLKQVDATADVAAQAGGGVAGTVAMGMPWSVSCLLGLPLLQAVSRQLPLVRLEFTEGPSAEISDMLLKGRLDLAVVFGPHGNLQVRPLVTEPLRLVGRRGSLPSLQPTTLKRAAQLPLLLMSRPNGIREELERIWASGAAVPRIVADVNAPRLLIDGVHAGLGFAILPACALGLTNYPDDLDVVELIEDAPRRTVCLATSPVYAQSIATERVQDLLEQLIREAVRTRSWGASLIGSGEGLDEAVD